VAAVGDGREFKKGRGFAAWLGVVPRHWGTGGKTRLGGISKRGDVYLRQLFIHGARAVVRYCHKKGDGRSLWLQGIVSRSSMNCAVVAQANKTARIAWAVLAKGEEYREAV
jgi:transposase